MKKWAVAGWWAIVAGCLCLCEVVAGPVSLTFTCERKRFEVARANTGSEAVKDEKLGYSVRIDNRTFKDLGKLEVGYILFGEEDVPGTRSSKELFLRGRYEVGAMLKNGSVTFETAPLPLSSSTLQGGWEWASGAPSRSRARLRGIWIRVFQDGKVVAEHATLGSLMKLPWDSPPGVEVRAD